MKNRAHSSLRIAAAPLTLLGLALPALFNCNNIEIPSSTCTELESGDVRGLKLDGPKKTFITAAVELDKLVFQVEDDLIKTCQGMGKTLGVEEIELDAEPDRGEGAKRVCDLVIEELNTLYADIGDVTIDIAYEPPRCEQDVGVTRACLAGCDESFNAKSSELSCKDGEISGVCEDACVGSCILPKGSACEGTCEGDCSGKCDGEDPKDGKPTRCAGKCEGSCSGACTAESKATEKPAEPPSSSDDDDDDDDDDKKPKKHPTCRGLCQGTCADGLRNATCSGEPTAKVAPACVTPCAVAVAPTITCRPPTLSIDVRGDEKPPREPGQPPREPTEEEKKQQENRNKLLEALRQGLPRLLAIQEGLDKRLSHKIDALVELGKSTAVEGADANDRPALCLSGANDILGRAVSAYRLDVYVSGSVAAAARPGSGHGKDHPSGPEPSKPTPKAAPKAPPKAAPKAAPKAPPQAAPKAAPKAPPKAAPQAAPEAGPKAAPKAPPEAGPKPSKPAPAPAP